MTGTILSPIEKGGSPDWDINLPVWAVTAGLQDKITAWKED